MSEVNKAVESMETMEVEVVPNETPIPETSMMPSMGSIRKSMIDAAAGVVAGVIIHTAISGAVIVGKKAFNAAKDGVGGWIENRKEQKLLKALEAEEKAQAEESETEED